jgi:hypothetical protein
MWLMGDGRWAMLIPRRSHEHHAQLLSFDLCESEVVDKAKRDNLVVEWFYRFNLVKSPFNFKRRTKKWDETV